MKKIFLDKVKFAKPHENDNKGGRVLCLQIQTNKSSSVCSKTGLFYPVLHLLVLSPFFFYSSRQCFQLSNREIMQILRGNCAEAGALCIKR